MVNDIFSPAQLGPVTLRNRVIKAATFEGRSPNGEVTDADRLSPPRGVAWA